MLAGTVTPDGEWSHLRKVTSSLPLSTDNRHPDRTEWGNRLNQLRQQDLMPNSIQIPTCSAVLRVVHPRRLCLGGARGSAGNAPPFPTCRHAEVLHAGRVGAAHTGRAYESPLLRLQRRPRCQPMVAPTAVTASCPSRRRRHWRVSARRQSCLPLVLMKFRWSP